MLFNISFKVYWFSGKLSILLWCQVDKANKFKLGRHNLLVWKFLAYVSDNLSSVSVELVKQLCFPRVTVHLIMSAAPHLQFFFCLCLWSCCLLLFRFSVGSFMEDSCVLLPLYLLYIGNIMELRDIWDLPLLQRGVI